MTNIELSDVELEAVSGGVEKISSGSSSGGWTPKGMAAAGVWGAIVGFATTGSPGAALVGAAAGAVGYNFVHFVEDPPLGGSGGSSDK